MNERQPLPVLHICLIHPPGHLYADSLLDPALYFRHQFERLGATVSFERNRLRHGAVNFVFGAHNGFDAGLCKNYSCVLVNLEQMGDGGAPLQRFYLDLLRSSVVVDYDPANPPAYTAHPQDVPIVSFGYAPYLRSTGLPALEARPIDLLFFGSMNPRRHRLIGRIEATGRKVTLAPIPLYGAERDALIQRSKAVVNLPYYESSRFEQVRAFLCLSLGTPVLSERRPAARPPDAFDACVTWFDETQIDRLFGLDFGTADFYSVLRRQVELFAQADPVDEYAEVLAFVTGVWQAHRQTAAGQTRGDVRLRFSVAASAAAAPQPAAVAADAADAAAPASRLFRRLNDATQQVESCIAAGRHDDALRVIAAGVHQDFCLPAVAHHALYYPDFDRQIERLSARLGPSGADTAGPARMTGETTLIVATEMFQVGGHTKVIEDIARQLVRPLIVLTDLFASYCDDPQKMAWIRSRFDGIEVVCLPEASFWAKCRALADLAAARSVTNILYVQHHQDPVAFVGTLGHRGSRKFLIHHCDHNPSLGCTLDDVRHVDLSGYLQRTCESHLQQPVQLLSLHVPDKGCRDIRPVQGAKFSVVTSGRHGKFSRYGDVTLHRIVATTLQTIGGSFYFVGPLPQDWLAELRGQLQLDDIDPERFVALGQVESLWDCLLALDVAFYLGSAPVGGGRAAVEAQGTGLPTLFFNGIESGSLIDNYSLYANAELGWATPDQLAGLLTRVAASSQALGRQARAYYESQFSKQHFRIQLEQMLGGAALANRV